MAAEGCYPNGTDPFLDYAILGHDLVIADEAVAKLYKTRWERLKAATPQLGQELAPKVFKYVSPRGLKKTRPDPKKAFKEIRANSGTGCTSRMPFKSKCDI